MTTITSGQPPFTFVHRDDLSTLPAQVRQHEIDLHGGFAVDDRPGFGHIYYGMPGSGLMRIDPDLTWQELIRLPPELTNVNFHSTRIGDFDGRRRLFLPANDDEMVAVLTLEGDVEFILPRPALAAYQQPDAPFQPTDVALAANRLWVADGYGSNYILTADLHSRQWTDLFGGHTTDPNENGKFGTAHGIAFEPLAGRLAIADRLLSRIQLHERHGTFHASHRLPAGAWPCGIQYIEFEGRRLAIVGCLFADVDQRERPAPIYMLDANSYEILSTVRPKEHLGVELAHHLHNVVAVRQEGALMLVCQAWNPGHYFVLQMV